MAKEKIEGKAGKVITNCDQLSDTIDIQPMIKVIRGQQVMLDSDLSALYGVETRRLNEQVKRNIERFPDDFMFQLRKEELDNLMSQNATSSWGGTRKLPYAFTEQGIAMLSSVLKSQTAVEVNIRIMRAFIAMRRFIATNAQLFQRLETIEYHQLEMKQHQEVTDRRIDEVFKRLDTDIPPMQGIFYDGQVFDAYRFVSYLIRKAKQSIVLIDNYVDDTVLTLLDKRSEGVSATIYTQRVSSQFQLDVDRHNSQYPLIEIKRFNKAHDRFLLIDNEVYHIGASIKDLGKKWFGFTLMRDITATELIKKIKD
ncbi:ORF6N domain-containing protein [Segatella copri]|uniref:ORF6N domain-containing protein n=1 Tax=Segatella copri TaxID=165179 RepID=UPI001290C35A|nr:ORF6N domain-containing protein [Segatella copri]MQN14601.1 ORF6N domain-containing protein [Segatella copri]MQN19508.1 ORF6N domain-containing protein [Segatella copri]